MKKKMILNEKLQDLEDKVKKLESREQNLKENNERLRKMLDIACCVCYEEFSENCKQQCFFPCGHAHTCESCYKKLPIPKLCPYCQHEIQNNVQLFN